MKRLLFLSALIVYAFACWTCPTIKLDVSIAAPTTVPSYTPHPTYTPYPTVDVAATKAALASLAADAVATALAQASATMGASTPTPTDTPTPTPVLPTATATQPPTPPRPTPVPAAMPEPSGSITLTIYLRGTNTETGFAALSGDQPYGWKIYEEGEYVYGEAAIPIGDTVYHFDKPAVGPGEPEQLPDPWRVAFEFAEDLVGHTGNQAGFDAKKAGFWVGTLDDTSAMAEDKPYSLTMKLYEGDELRASLQIFFTVADPFDSSSGGGGCRKPPCPP